MHKVKYTQKEYREEYLRSEEWKNLRNTILSSKPNCQCCENKATDVHHMVYRNIVDIKVSDLLPVCRTCHDFIHTAIKDNWIPTSLKHSVEEIRKITVGIRKDEDYARHREWLNSKHFLSKEEIEEIKSLQRFVIQKISSIKRKNVWYDQLEGMKFTGRQIIKIRNICKFARSRRDHRKPPKYKRFNKFEKRYISL
jgi:hypothetical protein